eukprot:jgi/Tetstr1/456148/TSEL_042917.t1
MDALCAVLVRRETTTRAGAAEAEAESPSGEASGRSPGCQQQRQAVQPWLSAAPSLCLVLSTTVDELQVAVGRARDGPESTDNEAVGAREAVSELWRCVLLAVSDGLRDETASAADTACLDRVVQELCGVFCADGCRQLAAAAGVNAASPQASSSLAAVEASLASLERLPAAQLLSAARATPMCAELWLALCRFDDHCRIAPDETPATEESDSAGARHRC